MSSRWGLELKVPEGDKNVWRDLLRAPCDPYVEEIKDDSGSYLVLRSSVFDDIRTPKGFHQAAKQYLAALNVAMSLLSNVESVQVETVVEFVQGGQPRKHRYLIAEGIAMRFRLGIADTTFRDELGNLVEHSPLPSQLQLWMRAASLDPDIGSALRYLQGEPSWFELYKAYEAVRTMPRGGIPKSEVDRFTQTANTGERHHPNKKHKPHKSPMQLNEARTLITQWVSAAIDDILARSP